MAAPLVAVGDIIRISQADSCYGRDELHMRVTHVLKGANTPGLEWLGLIGVEIRHDGSDGQHRHALVRVAALRSNPPQQCG
jgi:hypothetical protein